MYPQKMKFMRVEESKAETEVRTLLFKDIYYYFSLQHSINISAIKKTKGPFLWAADTDDRNQTFPIWMEKIRELWHETIDFSLVRDMGNDPPCHLSPFLPLTTTTINKLHAFTPALRTYFVA
jgi:hypothetical protein